MSSGMAWRRHGRRPMAAWAAATAAGRRLWRHGRRLRRHGRRLWGMSGGYGGMGGGYGGMSGGYGAMGGGYGVMGSTAGNSTQALHGAAATGARAPSPWRRRGLNTDLTGSYLGNNQGGSAPGTRIPARHTNPFRQHPAHSRHATRVRADRQPAAAARRAAPPGFDRRQDLRGRPDRRVLAGVTSYLRRRTRYAFPRAERDRRLGAAWAFRRGAGACAAMSCWPCCKPTRPPRTRASYPLPVSSPPTAFRPP